MTHKLATSNDVLTTGDAATLCGVSFRTVLRWIERGLLPAYKLPGRGDRRIRRSDLDIFMLEHGMSDPVEVVTTAPRPRRILIVDDEPAMARSIERVLRRAGYDTSVALSGFEAGTMLGSWQPALMTLDLRMPGMDGLDVLRFLQRTALPQAPRILVVSADEEARLLQALELGAHGILRKPFDNRELRAAVDVMLA